MALGGQNKLVRPIGGGLSSIGLEKGGLVWLDRRSALETGTTTVCAYQGNGAGWGGLVGTLVGEEKKTLAGLARPGCEVVVLQQGRKLLGVNGLGAEPEELLGVDEVPRRDRQLTFQPKSALFWRGVITYLGKLLPLCSS